MTISSAVSSLDATAGNRNDDVVRGAIDSGEVAKTRLASRRSRKLMATADRMDAIAIAIQETGMRELKLARCICTDSELIIEGTVSSFYVKQVATEAVRPLAQGLRIHNHLEVADC
ncbi:hypothetical protein [Rubripirellula reticaptiva]|uniref:BON domain protein n=1 Tax=Rubripirellula reticaptiva TaxID=2528013 RepID=A0A5C6EI19_9BACT|nr:hypothetical protein [Rubripirellula reticaptiva]TWU46889.1 hypothetical protein Poly59_58630 [Rubripirellula reticaptiva]